MTHLQYKQNVIEKFHKLMEDDSNVPLIDGVFDSLKTGHQNYYNIPEDHYLKVQERYKSYHSNENNSISLDTLSKKIEDKYEL